MKIDDLTIGEAKQLAAMLGSAPSTNQPVVNGDFRIVILQRGWVFVGKFYQNGDDCRIEDAHCIRVWGTTKGLGELAISGPLKDTKLDPSGVIRFNKFSVVGTLDTEAKKWKM